MNWLHLGIWEVRPLSSPCHFRILVPEMGGLNPDSLEFIILIQDYGGCRRRLLCPLDLFG